MCTVVPSCVYVDIELNKLSGKFTLKATQHGTNLYFKKKTTCASKGDQDSCTCTFKLSKPLFKIDETLAIEKRLNTRTTSSIIQF